MRAAISRWPPLGQRTLFEHLERAEIPEDPDERAAVALGLQGCSVNKKPAGPHPTRAGWHTSGSCHNGQGYTSCPRIVANNALNRVAPYIDGIPLMTHTQDAYTAEPQQCDLLYLDPPYQGVTGYTTGTGAPAAADLGRLVDRWRPFAKVIAISEHVPFDYPGATVHTLTLGTDTRGHTGKKRPEILTVIRGET